MLGILGAYICHIFLNVDFASNLSERSNYNNKCFITETQYSVDETSF